MKNLSSFVFGAVNGLALVLYFLIFPESWTFKTVFVIGVSIIISFPLNILLHEVGHVIAGRLQGMRLLNISVGPLVIERHEGKNHFHITRSTLGYLGRAMMYFPEPLDKTVMRDKLISYIYGGPVTNIILSVISFGLAFGIWHHPFFLIFGVINLLVGASNLTPVAVKSMMSDGLVIQKLRSTPVEDSVFIASYLLICESLKSKDAKEWNPALISHVEKLIIEQTDEPTAKSLLQTISYYYLPNHTDKVMEIGREVAFTRNQPSSNFYEDTADIAFATALLFSEKLRDYPEIEESLYNISNVDAIAHLKRNALLSFIQSERKEAINNLKEAFTLLEKWHPLYLRGDREKILLASMIKKIEEGK